MVPGLDSSFDRPTPDRVAQFYAAGRRVWGGYFGIRPRKELGLAVLWSRADFDVVRNGGMTAIGFCSGWDDPVAIRDRAAAWGILPCVDVERGIRDDGLWVDDWLPLSGAGLYGNGSVHFQTGRSVGRGAAFNIVSGYFGYDPQQTWEPWLLRPAAPTGWQWQGGHTEFGIDVDSTWFDDWFAPAFSGFPQGVDMTPEEHQTLNDINARTAELYNAVFYGADSAGKHEYDRDRLAELAAAVANLQIPAAQLKPVLDAIAALKADLDGLTLKKA